MQDPMLDSREAIPELLTALDLLGPGADVGTGSGWFADLILRRSACERVYAIDVWMGRFDWDRGMTTVEFMHHTRNRLDCWDLRAVIMRMTSLDAAAALRPESLSWAYIDTSHEYLATLDEMIAWWDNVRSGGLLMGHDFSGESPGVIQAVREFVSEMAVPLWLTECDEMVRGSPVQSWIIPKP